MMYFTSSATCPQGRPRLIGGTLSSAQLARASGKTGRAAYDRELTLGIGLADGGLERVEGVVQTRHVAMAVVDVRRVPPLLDDPAVEKPRRVGCARVEGALPVRDGLEPALLAGVADEVEEAGEQMRKQADRRHEERHTQPPVAPRQTSDELGQTGGLAGWGSNRRLHLARLTASRHGGTVRWALISPCEVDDLSVLEEHPLQPREPQHLREACQPQRPQDLVVRSLHRVGHVSRAWPWHFPQQDR